jgi:hypothetical protein
MTGFGSLEVLESDCTTMPPHRSLALLCCDERGSVASEAHQTGKSHRLSQRDMRPAYPFKGEGKIMLQVMVVAGYQTGQQQSTVFHKIYHDSLPGTIADKYYPA